VTQKELILSMFKDGERFMDSNVWHKTQCRVSAPSYKRIVKELRDAGVPILDVEIQPENGGHCYKEYYYGKPAIKQVAHQESDNKCNDPACPGSYWYIGQMCVKCGAMTGKGKNY